MTLLVPGSASARSVANYEFATPVFGLSTVPGSSALVVADAGAGVVRLQGGTGQLIAPLPGVTDVAPLGPRKMHAVTGAPASALYWIVDGSVRKRADIAAFEARVNPDRGPTIESNAFDVAPLPHFHVLVADAAGNSLLMVGPRGRISWVATFPPELVPTANAKRLAGCPDGPPDICGLPAEIPAEAVSTSVAVGPDGAYYVGELKGFPAPRGYSRIWRIEPGSHQVRCGSSPSCRVVFDGFTSIIDLSFGEHGTLYVTEFDEASWLAVEEGAGDGGTINACNVWTRQCSIVRGGLSMPTATATRNGLLWATVDALVPGAARVVRIT